MNKKHIFLALSIVVALVAIINIQQHEIDNNAYTLVSNKLDAQTQEASDRIKQLHSQEQTVYDICNESRISSTISEHQCGELQDKYHMEFLCKQNNNLSTNMCWVEYKGTNWTIDE